MVMILLEVMMIMMMMMLMLRKMSMVMMVMIRSMMIGNAIEDYNDDDLRLPEPPQAGRGAQGIPQVIPPQIHTGRMLMVVRMIVKMNA